MKIKIITAKEPEELEEAVNVFIDSKKVISISFSVGAYPDCAEFYALILYENLKQG